jgi:hypothetical protein
VTKDAPIRHGLLTPRDFALIMVSIGLASLRRQLCLIGEKCVAFVPC